MVVVLVMVVAMWTCWLACPWIGRPPPPLEGRPATWATACSLGTPLRVVGRASRSSQVRLRGQALAVLQRRWAAWLACLAPAASAKQPSSTLVALARHS